MENTSNEERMVYWDGAGHIIPHLLYRFLVFCGFGKYFHDNKRLKNSENILIKRSRNIISEVNIGYLLETVNKYIQDYFAEEGDPGPVLDSLHKSTSLFGDKNLKLLPILNLEFISDTKDTCYFFFRNGVVKVTDQSVSVHNYDEFDRYVWENNIINIDFVPVSTDDLGTKCNFHSFLYDLTIVRDVTNSAARLKSLKSAVGYLLHRYKDGNTNQAVILMDIYVNGMPNGGSGKSLLINSIGKIRNLATIDGKKYDQAEWFALSSVGLDSEILLFDDVKKEFDFEQIFTLMSGGMYIRRKYKDHVHIPHEKSPKVAITTNYAVNGDSSSHKRRKFEFEVSTTYCADYSPREKFGKNFFDDWSELEWNYFYNTMMGCVQIYLNEGLVQAKPINLNLTKMINRTNEEFVEWAEIKITTEIQYDKKKLYDNFVKAYPEYSGKLKQRDFTFWLRAFGDYKKFNLSESHSGDFRYITFNEKQES